MAIRGSIQTMPVGDLLEWLDRRLLSGTLTLTKGPIVRRFHLDSGYITLASSSEQKVLLGRLLVERGLLAQSDLERALRAGRETGARLGRVLTLVGLVPEAEMQDLLRRKVLAMITGALSWTDGRFSFDDEFPVPGRPMINVSVNLRDALQTVPSVPVELQPAS